MSTQAKTKTRAAVWREANIDAEKRKVKLALDQSSDPHNPRIRLLNGLRLINELENDVSPETQLTRYILVMSMLTHHLHQGGLSRSQVRNLISMAEAILRTQGIEPGGSRLSFLYGDIHLILSQIHWQAGEQWEAAWEQHFATRISGYWRMSERGVNSLATGIRILRLGHPDLAITWLERAEEQGLSGPYVWRARLERLKALRISGELTKAIEYWESIKAMEGASEAETKECHWEALCREAQITNTVGNLIQAVNRNQSHHFPSYILETFFWIRTVKTNRWVERYPTFRRLARDPSIDSRPFGILHTCIQAFEKCEDHQSTFTWRLSRLGKMLSQSPSILSADRELLVWAAAVRWLSRTRTSGEFDLVLRQYRALSLKLTAGKKQDALNVLSDLV